MRAAARMNGVVKPHATPTRMNANMYRTMWSASAGTGSVVSDIVLLRYVMVDESDDDLGVGRTNWRRSSERLSHARDLRGSVAEVGLFPSYLGLFSLGSGNISW